MKPTARDKIACSRCCGTGKVPLPYELAATLSFVRQRGVVTTPDVFRDLMRSKGTPTSANNRLEQLEKLGLVRVRDVCRKPLQYWAPMRKP